MRTALAGAAMIRPHPLAKNLIAIDFYWDPTKIFKGVSCYGFFIDDVYLLVLGSFSV